MKVIFSHGKESGPWGSKIKRLAGTAKRLGFAVDSIDYTGIVGPDARVDKLCDFLSQQTQAFILLGSSMGGYVSLVAAEKYPALGVFLLAPALYIDGYLRHDYQTDLANVTIVHGWRDDIIPIEHSIKYGNQARCTVHLLDSDHRLNSSLDQIDELFSRFLEKLQ